jgi:hypothetical protein
MKSLTVTRLTVILSVIGLCAGIAFAQPTASAQAGDTLSGRYEGTAKLGGNDVPVSLDLKRDGNKVTGRGTAGQSTAEISEGTFVDGTLTLKFTGEGGTLIAKVNGDTITGDVIHGDQKGAIELKKVPAAGAAAAAAVNLNGEWEAVADANGQPFPFLLTLKIDGEKVTGGSSSQLGDSVISSGTWKDGQLNFVMEGQNGAITMNATVIEGKLSGLFDYAGQLQGKWVAVKKK